MKALGDAAWILIILACTWVLTQVVRRPRGRTFARRNYEILHEAMKTTDFRQELADMLRQHPGGDSSCWGFGASFMSCCAQHSTLSEGNTAYFFHAPGDPECWDATYTFDRCCLGGLTTRHPAPGAFSPMLRPDSLAPGEGKHVPSWIRTCPRGSAPFVAVGELRTSPLPSEGVRRALDLAWLLFDLNPHDSSQGAYPLEVPAFIEFAGSRSAAHDHIRYMLAESITVTPDANALLTTAWFCLVQNLSTALVLPVVRHGFFSLWSKSSLLALRAWTRTVQASRQGSPENQREHAQVLGSLWALEATAAHAGMNIALVSLDELRPACSVGSSGRLGLVCDFGRLPLWCWGLAATLLLPGALCAGSSLRALVYEKPEAVVILDAWRVVMSLLILSAHISEDRYVKPLGDGLPTRSLLGNSLAFALSVRLQGGATQFPSRLMRRWSRQVPSRLALVFLELLVIRGLFTSDFAARPLLQSAGLLPQGIIGFSDHCEAVLYFYRSSFLGPFTELLEPLPFWFKTRRPFHSCVNLWFFRVEATLWAGVALCRALGHFGWLILSGVFASFIAALIQEERRGDMAPALLSISFPCCAAAYIVSSAWRAASLGHPWREPASLAMLAVSCALCSRFQLVEAHASANSGIPDAASGRHYRWLPFLVYQCLLVSGLEGILDAGSGSWARLPGVVLTFLRALGRLSFGVCLLHYALVLTWIWGPVAGTQREDAPFAAAWISSLLCALVLWVFVQCPTERAFARIIGSARE